MKRVAAGWKSESVRSINKLKEESIFIKQRQVLRTIKLLNEQAKTLLKVKLDTVDLNKFIERSYTNLNEMKDGVLVNVGTYQTQRNLAVSKSILEELELRVNEKKLVVDKYVDRITAIKIKIDSASLDPSLLYFPKDSVAVINFLKRIVVTAKEINPIDSALELATKRSENFQQKFDLLGLEIRSKSEDLDILTASLSGKILEREFSNLWGEAVNVRPIGQIMKFSISKELLLFYYYSQDHNWELFCMLIGLLIGWYFLKSLKNQLQEDNLLAANFEGQLVFKHPFLSTVLIFICLFQFFFPFIPFVFDFSLWVICIVCLTKILKGHITGYWFRFWLIVVTLFLFAGLDNLILQASRLERYLILTLSFSGLIYAINVLTRGPIHELKERKLVYAIYYMAIMQFLAILLNVFGRFNLAKTLMVTGYLGLIIALLFLWNLRLVNQTLSMAFKAYKKPNYKLFYVNFEKIGETVPWPFYLVLVLGWFLVVGRNFYGFNRLSAPLLAFLNDDRTIGNYSFSIMSIVIFMMVLVISVVLSKLISYFAIDSIGDGSTHVKPTKTLGNWLLLIRIFIISGGLFLACAAAGIPLDRFTIVFGALGVGIGLGLQGLVNNLISGLIISLERTVNVGETIEVNGVLCTMKSIGFRSSEVISVEGPNIIVPNGELLSHQLINWSKGKNRKGCKLPITIEYNSDLDKVKNLLQKIATEDDRIAEHPEPNAFFMNFGESAIELELVYWIKNFRENKSVRSDLMMKINDCFKAEGVIIPYPKQTILFESKGDDDHPAP
ncbi:mechanosensitive ion channel family protein [Pedobacter sp. MW01-1-1]|uniref:mechanosensitive ion channel family protein n=1 Tax=Pedobacter sp. MW01-1-1 TaxID=3383027 RepID=UPI003FF10B9C